MSNRRPYTAPRLVRYESEADCPDRIRDIVRSLRLRFEAPQFEVEPQYFVVVDSDRKYVEVSDMEQRNRANILPSLRIRLQIIQVGNLHQES